MTALALANAKARFKCKRIQFLCREYFRDPVEQLNPTRKSKFTLWVKVLILYCHALLTATFSILTKSANVLYVT